VTWLLDANVLIALCTPDHVDHTRASDWFFSDSRHARYYEVASSPNLIFEFKLKSGINRFPYERSPAAYAAAYAFSEFARSGRNNNRTGLGLSGPAAAVIVLANNRARALRLSGPSRAVSMHKVA
jgi:predicted nucleic acid-binding protein